ncbi:MAG: TetR/AcrR family transcriptional regulator [Chloroflexi bacterium]|nr:TetR/AcrR family transcriptional regulator [Chloroflexota bacterium]
MTRIALDRQVKRTRKLLQDALMELILEEGFDSVRVQDILDKADVGRSTFYVHFQNKTELLHSCFDGLHALLEQALESSEDKGNIHPYFSFQLFQFVERNPLLFKAMLGKPGASAFLEDFLSSYIHEPLKTRMLHHRQSPVPPEIVTHHFVSVFIGTLKWWIGQDMPCPAEQMEEYFTRLVMPGVEGIQGR